MKVVVAGSRTIRSLNEVDAAIRGSGFQPTQIISGGARGVDQLAEVWAENNKVPVTVVRPEWKKKGWSAGFERNKVMAGMADAVVVVWDGESRGSRHMIDTAKGLGLPVHVRIVRNGRQQGLVFDPPETQLRLIDLEGE